MWTLSFWQATVERAVRTFAQTLSAFLVADLAFTDVDWSRATSIAGMATVGSVLTSLVASQMGNYGPSLANEVTSPPAPAIDADAV